MRDTISSPATSPVLPAELSAGFEPAELSAGLLAAALPYLAEWGLDHPSLDEVLQELGVSPARAAEAEAAALEVLPMVRLSGLCREVTAFLMDHPGTAEVSPRRLYYSRRFRRFVLDLRGRYDDVALEKFANAVGVAQGTLAGWLRRARRSCARACAPSRRRGSGRARADRAPSCPLGGPGPPYRLGPSGRHQLVAVTGSPGANHDRGRGQAQPVGAPRRVTHETFVAGQHRRLHGGEPLLKFLGVFDLDAKSLVVP